MNAFISLTTATVFLICSVSDRVGAVQSDAYASPIVDTCDQCSPYADCTASSESFSCSCQSGFSGDGLTCTDIDECLSINCPVCTNNLGSFYCSCPPGEYFDGNNCTAIDCSSNDPCVNGSCNATSNLCACDTGYGGPTCSINIDDCASDPCDRQHGTCVDGIGNYTCVCETGFEGADCSQDINECESGMVYCDACSDTFGSYQCLCIPGRYQNSNNTQCLNISCASSPCKNGASCIEQNGTSICACAPGFSGNDCSLDIDECADDGICGAHGVCSNYFGSYSCTCDVGFSGIHCSNSAKQLIGSTKGLLIISILSILVLDIILG